MSTRHVLSVGAWPLGYYQVHQFHPLVGAADFGVSHGPASNQLISIGAHLPCQLQELLRLLLCVWALHSKVSTGDCHTLWLAQSFP